MSLRKLTKNRSAILSYTWHKRPGSVMCHLSPSSDVADIYDEWHTEIRAYQCAVSFAHQSGDVEMPGALVAAAVLVQLGQGALLIEGDGVFLGQALALAQQWEKQ